MNFKGLFTGNGGDAREQLTVSYVGCRTEGEEVVEVSEPLPWYSGELYPENAGTVGGREVIADWSFGSREVE